MDSIGMLKYIFCILCAILSGLFRILNYTLWYLVIKTGNEPPTFYHSPMQYLQQMPRDGWLSKVATVVSGCFEYVALLKIAGASTLAISAVSGLIFGYVFSMTGITFQSFHCDWVTPCAMFCLILFISVMAIAQPDYIGKISDGEIHEVTKENLQRVGFEIYFAMCICVT